MSSKYNGNFESLSITLGDGGTYTYLDSGVPPTASSPYTTIIAVHGLAYNARESCHPQKVASPNINPFPKIFSEESLLSLLHTVFEWLHSTVADMEVLLPIRQARP